MDQNLAQIDVAPHTDAQQLRLASVEYCRGTTPSPAAKSRPLLNAAPLPIAATMVVATIGPMAGI